MKRGDLERQLRALGFAPLSQSGATHTLWIAADRSISVPNSDIILDRVAAQILNLAKG